MDCKPVKNHFVNHDHCSCHGEFKLYNLGIKKKTNLYHRNAHHIIFCGNCRL